MRHLKRFKNWLAVAYYACWAYSQQFRAQANNDEQSESHENLVAADDSSPSRSLSANTSHVEVAEKIDEPVVETAPVIAPNVEVKKSSTPEPKALAKQEVSPKPQKPTPPPAVSVKVQAEQVPAKPKSNGAVRVTEQQSSNGKYQPGAINDQTAQRLARLLVSEIKLYYKSKSEGGESIDTTNIYDLLKDPIEKSRQHYNQRMGKSAIESMPDYFHGELVRSLCGGDASRLGPNYPAGKGA